MDKFLTGGELAARVRVSPNTVRVWRHKNIGPPWFRVGGRVLYAEADVNRWLKDARNAVGAA